MLLSPMSDKSGMAVTYAIGPIWTCLLLSLKDEWNGPICGIESAGASFVRLSGFRMAPGPVEPRFLIYNDI